jgi:hypothetical protein
MWEIIWGFKTVALFDVWTFEHILGGLSIGAIVKKDNQKHIKNIHRHADPKHRSAIRMSVIAVLFCAYIWEAVEHYLEQGLAGKAVEFWFQGTEFWGNRLITDPLMLVVGYFFILKYPRLVVPARILSLAWLILHIFVFPHSMYLHNFLS